MRDGETGFVVDGFDEAVTAVRRLPEIDRATCRRVFETHFSAPRMAVDYCEIYEDLIAGRVSRPRRQSGTIPIATATRRIARPA